MTGLAADDLAETPEPGGRGDHDHMPRTLGEMLRQRAAELVAASGADIPPALSEDALKQLDRVPMPTDLDEATDAEDPQTMDLSDEPFNAHSLGIQAASPDDSVWKLPDVDKAAEVSKETIERVLDTLDSATHKP